jgi:hypothetical protein
MKKYRLYGEMKLVIQFEEIIVADSEEFFEDYTPKLSIPYPYEITKEELYVDGVEL